LKPFWYRSGVAADHCRRFNGTRRRLEPRGHDSVCSDKREPSLARSGFSLGWPAGSSHEVGSAPAEQPSFAAIFAGWPPLLVLRAG